MFTTLALALLAPAMAQEACDPAAFSEDPAAFADLAVQDFESFTSLPSDSLVVDGLAYEGSAFLTDGWCIPGMDSGITSTGYACGGDNQYLASAVDLTITPLAPTERIGFRYGTQGDWFDVTVELSDGSVHVFHPDGDGTFVAAYPGWEPVVGFFGYCTAGTGLTIASIHLSAGDGGIDDVRYGVAGSGEPPAPTCDADSIEEQILGLGLATGIENALLAKVDVAQRAQPATAIHILNAMIQSIEAQRGKHIAEADADALIACVQAWIVALGG